ncbi:MAG: proton-conducting transporter membrane subunit [Pseudomonadota bacterium]
MCLLFLVATFYGIHYLDHYRHRENIGSAWLCYNLLMASMILVLIVQNVVLFLVCWEIMSLTSFLLVIFHHEKEPIQKAGWLYLSITHLGTACLIVFFLLLTQNSDGQNFGNFTHTLKGPVASLCFLLALIGFGTKAGIIPLHSWLPEAHPAAPGHVSALMSGVMIKMGIYGIIRTLTFFADIPKDSPN